MGAFRRTTGGGSSGGGAVTSVAGRTGVVVLANTDISGLGTASTHPSTDFDTAGAASTENTRALAAEALLAPLASPALTGNPTVPTQTALTNSTKAASTAYTDAAVGVETTRATTAEALLAPKASPALTGTPTVPTAAGGTNTTQAASTAFVTAAIPAASAVLPTADTVGAAIGSSAAFAKADHSHTRAYFHPSDFGFAAMSVPPDMLVGQTSSPVSGTVYVAQVILSAITTITTAYVDVATAGSGLTASQCLVGLYDPSNTLIGTASTNSGATNLATAFASAGFITITLTASGTGLTSLAAGKYRVAIMQVGTTPAILAAGNNRSSSNGALVASASKYASADTGRTTTLPGTLGALTAFSGAIFAAIS